MSDSISKDLPNMPLFQAVVCHVMTQTQTAFPNKIDISCSTLAHMLINQGGFNCVSPLDLAIEISAAIDWLEKAGLIWFGGHELNDYFDVTLSKHALAKLLSDINGSNLAAQLAKATTSEQQLAVVKQLIA